MRLWPWRRRAHDTDTALQLTQPAAVAELSAHRSAEQPVSRAGALRMKIAGHESIGAGGNVSDNAIGAGSSTVHIDQVIVNPSDVIAARSRRQIAPPPLGEIADRRDIREAVQSALLKRPEPGHAPVVFLEGYGGGGKTTIALQSCQIPEIRERFPGGVIWTAIGTSRVGPKLADHIADICGHLSTRRPTTTDPVLAGAAFGELLDEGAPTLVVVDDVWSKEQVEPFLLGGSECARLFTTRNRGLAPSFGDVIEVGQMTEDEARATALAGLPTLDPTSADNLLKFAKGWPVLLGLINASLQVHIKAGGPLEEVTAWIASLIDSEGPAALDSTAPQQLRSTIDATVSASLDLLSPEEQARYFDLAVFDEDSDIPEHIVALLWQTTGNLSRAESRRMKDHLASLRLVYDRWVGGEPAIAVHDVLRSYVLHRLSAYDLARRNLMLVTALRTLLPPASQSQWWQLPSGEEFAMQHIPHHLRAAGLDSELGELACDLRWIEAQIRRLGSVVPAVSTLLGVPGDKAAALRVILDHDTEMLVPDSAPSAVGATLVSRLQDSMQLRETAVQHLERLPRPVLQCLWPLPDVISTSAEGHTGPIGDCAISPDGKLLATASDDRLVIIWDIATMTVRGVLRGHQQRARACVFSPDGTRLLSASMDGTIRIWDVEEASLLHTFGEPSTRTLGCAWSPDGCLIAAASGNGKLSIWTAATGDKHREIDSPSGYEWDCSFSPDSRTMASGAEDGTIRLWDVEDGTLQASFAVHDGRIRCCTYDPSGTLIATAGSDTTVRITRSGTGEVVHVLRGHTDRVRACAFSADGSVLVSAAEDRTIRLWDVATGEAIRTLRGHTDWVGAAVFTKNGRQLVSCSGDITLRIWDASSGEVVHTAMATRNAVGCCSFSPDGSRIAAGGSDGTVRVHNTKAKEIVRSVKAHSGRVLDCTFAGSGLLTAGADGQLCLWDIETERLVRRYSGHSGRIWGCSIAPDEHQIASAGEDGLVLVHDLGSGDLVHTLEGHAGHALDCAFSPSGELVATVGDDGTLRLWNRATGRLESTLATGHETALWSCRFSPHGDLIATVGEPAAELTLWRTADHNIKSSISLDVDRITCCAFSPCGRYIATCGDDAYLGVWDVATGNPVSGIRVAYPLHECAWSNLGDKVLIAASGNGGLYLFEYMTVS
jgi:WD40 repeat protein